MARCGGMSRPASSRWWTPRPPGRDASCETVGHDSALRPVHRHGHPLHRRRPRRRGRRRLDGAPPAGQRVGRSRRLRHDRGGGHPHRRGAPRPDQADRRRVPRRGDDHRRDGLQRHPPRGAPHRAGGRLGTGRRPQRHAVLQQAERPGHQAALRGGRPRRRRHAGRRSTTSPAARRRTCRPSCSPRSRRSTASRASSSPTRPRCSSSTGCRCSPATTTSWPARSTSAAPAASASPATSSAPRCGACSTSPTSRAEIDAGLRELYAALFVTASPAPVKAALDLLGHRVGGLRLPLVEVRRRGAGGGPRRPGGPRAAQQRRSHRLSGTLRVLPARRPGGDRQEHDGRRVRRPDRRRGRRPALPDGRDDGHRPRPARLHVPARAPRRHRGVRHHPRPRGPHRRAAVDPARARPGQGPGHLRRAADGRHGALQARRAQAARREARGPAPRRGGRGRPVRGSSSST